MANNSYHKMIDSINEITQKGRNRKLGGIYFSDPQLNGRTIKIDERDIVHFGSCGYIGLELDDRLKVAGIDAINKYGMGFMCSKTYVGCPLYVELESKLETMFKGKVIVYPKLSQGHVNVLPMMAKEEDVVIFDLQAHISMHETNYKLTFNGVKTLLLRHNNMDDLESKINEYKGKCNRIWYVFDGIYSMFGDIPNYQRINELVSKYKQLHLYVDDAHGMSWYGENGSGFAYSKLENKERIVLSVSLAKSFGASGGAFVFFNHDDYYKVKGWGGSLTYAGPIEPPTLAAAIASADIHLSDEINSLQQNLHDKIIYCHSRLIDEGLPVISKGISPIFFIGLGTIQMGYSVVEGVLKDGFYTNLGVYPAVPESCTGLRFTLTNHLTLLDIDGLIFSIKKNFLKSLQEENSSIKDIIRAFRKYADLTNLANRNEYEESLKKNDFQITIVDSINKLNKEKWNNLMMNKGGFISDILETFEKVFQNNSKLENNWKFLYFWIELDGKVILASFFTIALVKDDMTADEFVSSKIEKIRLSDSYFLTSKCMMMGSLLTNGEHLYIDYDNNMWKDALKIFINHVWMQYEISNSDSLLIRDIEDKRICEEFEKYDFAKITLLDNNILNTEGEKIEEYYMKNLSKKYRIRLKNEVLKDLNKVKLQFGDCSAEELNTCYQLYLQTKNGNLTLNTFDLPYSLFEEINKKNDWEIIRVYSETNTMLSFGISYMFHNNYYTFIFGMDKNNISCPNLYKKSLYLIFNHVTSKGYNQIFLGITAEQAKRSLGAVQISSYGFMSQRDSYNSTLIHQFKDV